MNDVMVRPTQEQISRLRAQNLLIELEWGMKGSDPDGFLGEEFVLCQKVLIHAVVHLRGVDTDEPSAVADFFGETK